MLVALKAYRSRFLAPAWKASVGLMLFVCGIAFGTADLPAATFADYMERFGWAVILMPMLFMCHPRGAQPAAAAREARPGAPRPASGQPRLRAVPPVSD